MALLAGTIVKIHICGQHAEKMAAMLQHALESLAELGRLIVFFDR